MGHQQQVAWSADSSRRMAAFAPELCCKARIFQQLSSPAASYTLWGWLWISMLHAFRQQQAYTSSQPACIPLATVAVLCLHACIPG
jgi:hypothetical protein